MSAFKAASASFQGEDGHAPHTSSKALRATVARLDHVEEARYKYGVREADDEFNKTSHG